MRRFEESGLIIDSIGTATFESWYRSCADQLGSSAVEAHLLVVEDGLLIDVRQLESKLADSPVLVGEIGGRPALVAVHKHAASLAPEAVSGVEYAARHVRGEHGWADVLTIDLTDVAFPLLESAGHAVLGNKAETLFRLEPHLPETWTIPDSVALSSESWALSKAAAISTVRREIGSSEVIVRSSFSVEDGWSESHAGAFLSVPSVRSDADGDLTDAIDAVFRSAGQMASPEDLVLLQEYITDVDYAGVATTAHPDSAAPYFVLQLDTKTGGTDVVTSGARGGRTWFIDRESCRLGDLPEALADIVRLCRHLEELLGIQHLDVEVAARNERRLLLQARPLVQARALSPMLQDDRSRIFAEAEASLQAMSHSTESNWALSTMSDWNPAEMIGRRPLPLALSLYQELITNSTWAKQRREYGYRDLQSVPLVETIATTAFVDVHASLSSFVPASVPTALAEAIVARQLSVLVDQPELDDSIEFDVANTCAAVGLRKTLTERYGDLLDPVGVEEYARSLERITIAGLLDQDRCLHLLSQLDELPPITGMGEVALELDRICSLGTLPFAHLARTAFVSVTLLRDFAKARFISDDDLASVIASCPTPTSEFAHNVAAAKAGRLSISQLIDRHGHIRPGTYDIRAQAYHENPARYLEPLIASTNDVPAPAAAISDSASLLRGISAGLDAANLSMVPEEFLTATRKAISGREVAKDVFTKRLSRLLDVIGGWAQGVGLDRTKVAHLTLTQIREQPEDELETLAAQAVREHDAGHLVELPDLLTDVSQLSVFTTHRPTPSFATRQTVEGETVDGSTVMPDQIRGRIVVLEAADPGYDWILSHGPMALITAYGGANSHMTIRCAELGIPAAIGVGRSLKADLLIHGRALVDGHARRVIRG